MYKFFRHFLEKGIATSRINFGTWFSGLFSSSGRLITDLISAQVYKDLVLSPYLAQLKVNAGLRRKPHEI